MELWITGWVWAALGAALVVKLIEQATAESVVAVERGEDVSPRGADANLAFVTCTLCLFAAPLFLMKSRGSKGFVEGSLIVGGVAACHLVGSLWFFGHFGR